MFLYYIHIKVLIQFICYKSNESSRIDRWASGNHNVEGGPFAFLSDEAIDCNVDTQVFALIFASRCNMCIVFFLLNGR